MADVKICGIRDSAALDAALSGGARFVGFVQFEKSPRHVSIEQAASLFAKARGRADIVLVTVNASDEQLYRASVNLRPDYIQLHGSESPVRAAEVRKFAGKGVIKAIGVSRHGDLAQAAAFGPVADFFLFDAKPPPGGLPGGNALAFDWPILAGVSLPRPWFLSGGLNPLNIKEAITASGAALVDVSSGVETAPGLKDPLAIAQFLAAAKSASF
ncbi:phosphoribosylanthranilate isomerase [Terricaulis sp.]|uniref:phosphoribosylanthranilate isomerase n=1 Tax=Terricaulis sp. TaxID=2768686 RepID=UPI0037847C2C